VDLDKSIGVLRRVDLVARVSIVEYYEGGITAAMQYDRYNNRRHWLRSDKVRRDVEEVEEGVGRGIECRLVVLKIPIGKDGSRGVQKI